MDHDSMNRAKMRAEAALADATGLLYVMLDSPVVDIEDLEALRRVVKQDAVIRGLLKATTLDSKPTVAEEIHKPTSGFGDISISATLDVVSGDNKIDDAVTDLEHEPSLDQNDQ